MLSDGLCGKLIYQLRKGGGKFLCIDEGFSDNCSTDETVLINSCEISFHTPTNIFKFKDVYFV